MPINDYGSWSTLNIGNIDGLDGDLEVVFGGLYPQRVYLYHHDGTLGTGWPQPTIRGVMTSPALADVDGDGDLEIFVTADYHLYAWHHDGRPMSGWPQELNPHTSYQVNFSSPSIGDIDCDGDLEIVHGTGELPGLPGSFVYAWHHDGQPVGGWPILVPDREGFPNSGVHASPAIGDLDGDGCPEVVVGSINTWMYAWHGDGTPLEGWPIQVPGQEVGYSSPALGDIDGDGELEVVVGSQAHGADSAAVFAWNADGSPAEGWPRAIATAVNGDPSLGDVDGDGRLEIVAATINTFEGREIFVWNGEDGSLLPGWPLPDGEDPTFSEANPLLVDLDGDSDLEIIVAGWFVRLQGYSSGRVYGYHHDGAPVVGFPIDLRTEIFGNTTPALADLDGDGDLDMGLTTEGGNLIGGGPGKCHFWDLPWPYVPERVAWGMFHHDPQHTGLLPFNQPPVTADLALTPPEVGRGDTLLVTISLTNRNDLHLWTQVELGARLPGGRTVVVTGPRRVPIARSGGLSLSGRLIVPGNAPLGTIRLIVAVGSLPERVFATDFQDLQVVEGVRATPLEIAWLSGERDGASEWAFAWAERPPEDRPGPFNRVGDKPARPPLESLLGEDGSTSAAAERTFRITCYPNPFSVYTRVQIEAAPGAWDSPVSVSIYDLRGRMVRQIGVADAGSKSLAALWDGRDGQGRETPAGAYFVRVRVGASQVVQRIVRRAPGE